MNSERREEMISAYLDGELSVEERARVETWLAESPELRQLHDELKTLGASIQALPRHQLTQDLEAAVLRRAEQTVLAGGAARGPNASDIRPASKIPLWLRGAGWRRLAWPAVAVAAALVVMLFDAQQAPAPREVAQAPKGPTSIAARQEPPLPKLAAEAQPQTSAASPAQNASAAAKPSAAMSRYAAAPGEAAAGRALKDGDGSNPPLETVVYRVSPEFLRDNSLEKMLAKSQIAWTADNPADPAFGLNFRERDEPAAADSLATKATSPLGRKVYVLRVSDEQRTRILGELDAKSDQVRKIEALARDVANEQPEGVAISEERLGKAGAAVESDKRAKKVATIRPLRIVLEPSAPESAPVAPADGEAKP
jgi:anti-sigma factor RsiW